MMRTTFASMLAMAMVALPLAACGGGGTATGGVPTSKGGAAGGAAGNNEPAELVFYGAAGNTEAEFNARWGDYIRKQFPNYTLKYIMNEKGKTLPELIAAGETIDIIFDSIGGTASNLIDNGFQYDITELAKKHSVDLNRFEPTFIDAIKQMGGLYGLPVNGGGLVIYYNKDIFDKFGAPYPKDGMSWEELLELSKKVTRMDGGKQYAGFATSVVHPMRMNPFSLDVVDRKTLTAAIGNEKWKTLLQTVMIQPIVQDDGYRQLFTQKKGGLWTDDFAKQQNLAMFMMNFGLQYAVKEFETLNWDMTAIPTFKDRPGVGTQPYPNYFYITSASKAKDAAMNVLKYVTSDEHETIESKKGNIPVLKNEEIKKVFGQETIYKGKNMKNAVYYNKFAEPHAKTVYDDKVAGPLDANIKKVIYGEIDLNTAFRNAEQEANKAIEEMKAARKK
ncbi:ABC transporter substrate-binding protein [Paenibacillus sp. GYB003]|uniref:ABC transporter substrate-binding protein n=1 Tax=Paenibacillus sp. GYB003 TaxID=2994392 RepID=UPI002F961C6C